MGIIDVTKSICPECKKTIDAKIIIKGKKVYMQKRCDDHGAFHSLISSDKDLYLKDCNKVENVSGCCNDCENCGGEKNRTNIAIIDINNVCNLNCPVCINDTKGNSNFPIDKIKWMIEKYAEKEGKPEILQISGGEPTIHPNFFEIIDFAISKKINLVMINTNGLRIANDIEFVKELSERDVLVYLQFDGFKKETYQKIRGKDLSEIKLKAIENIKKHNLRAFLAVTIIKGINNSEIGSIVKLAMDCKNIEGIDFHSVAYTGRCIKCDDPLDRITMPDIIKSIEVQTNKTFKKEDFFSLPATDPRCCMLTYAFLRDNDVKVIPRVVGLDKYKTYFEDTIVHDPKEIVLDVIKGKLSAKEIYKDFYTVVGENFNPLKYRKYRKNILKIMVKPFMDPYTFDIKRAQKCRVHQITSDGKFVPFCVHTNLTRQNSV